MLNHCILRKHPNKESRVSVGVKTTSLRNADLKMRIVGTANRKGTLPRCAKRRFQPRVQSRIGGNNQLGMWKLANNQDDEFKLFQISQEKPEPSTMLPVKVNGEDCSMELETGASVSIMSEEASKKRFPKAPLEKSTLKLRTYTGEALDNIGQAHLQVAYQVQTANLPLQIIKGKGPSLF